MYDSSPSLLTRLRRHRGLWTLAVAVMLIKLIAGTVCLADAPEKRLVSDTTISAVSTPLDTVIADLATDDPNACLLGEGSACHCTCAHSATLPMSSMDPIARMEARFDTPAIRSGFAPAAPESLLRPPLA